ncbi:uncharacterized protein LOC110856648 isoform X2 [Folsomia candida]|nr:uncharacterized protein LOC110856648 isoform X2 [Folsomia candida]XP_021960830.1 uncharacterized protein LOC110856648 isoform X2 [Folsomia candida]XP_021960831.1 uncharacterized protein LOC110856648 isoform X2 [Folsomia candida]
MSNPVPLQDQEAGPSASSSGHHHKSKRPHDRPAKWVNPCRIGSALPAFPVGMDIEIVTQSDSEIISNIITQVNKAELQARRFIELYYRETFDEDLRESDKFAAVHYDFLNEINDKVKKSLGDKLSRDALEELKMAETLRSMYTGLQMFAVGLEQIVLDQSVYGGSFHKDFQETEYQLKYVLCELQIAMLEKGIQHEDVTREIMSGDYRDIDCKTIRNIRDWVIFRDYVNTLEYIQQSFSYFLATVDSS